MASQLDVVLSKVSYDDKETLMILDRLKRFQIKPGEAADELSGGAPPEPSLYCFLLMFQEGEETISIALGEISGSRGKLEPARGDIMAVIEEECRTFSSKVSEKEKPPK